MKTSIHNEYGRIVSVLMKRPSDAFLDFKTIEKQWKDLNYVDKPDFERSIQEYNLFEQLLSKVGSNLLYLDVNDQTGLDSIYTRDAAIATNEGIILCNMGKKARMFEPHAQRSVYEAAGINILGEIDPPGTVEGGDVAWLDESTLLIGRGFRTNEDGIRQVRNLVSGFAEVVEVHLPYYKGPSDVFHLMSVFSPVDKDLAVVYSPLMTVPFRELLESRNFRFIEVPEGEFDSMGCNVLALSPRTCVIVEGNPITKKALEDVGAFVYEYSGKEISLKGCGGPTCLTRPLLRQI